MEYLIGAAVGYAAGLIGGILLICLCAANGKEKEGSHGKSK